MESNQKQGSFLVVWSGGVWWRRLRKNARYTDWHYLGAKGDVGREQAGRIKAGQHYTQSNASSAFQKEWKCRFCLKQKGKNTLRFKKWKLIIM